MVNYIIQRLKGMMEINKLIKRIYDKNLRILAEKYENKFKFKYEIEI